MTEKIVGLSSPPVEVPDASTYSILHGNSGLIHIMPDLTADCTLTLPEHWSGLRFEFIYNGTAADAQDWIINTNAVGGADYRGGVVHFDTNAGSAGDEVVPVRADAVNDDTLTINTPDVGTHIIFLNAGSHWYVSGIVVSENAPVFS